ncbi:hypothetical protein [Cohnella sp. GCM10027633]|uniref:hypothetical protein n=1 Tax=unclassified Cohnella TaxID=2636738 RepID=UPI003632F12B
MIVQIGGFVLVAAIWSFFKVRSLAAGRQYKEAALYGGLMGMAIVFGSLLMAKVEMPSFTLPFKLLFEPIGRMLLKH